MNVSPKQRFLSEEKLARQFLDQVDSEAFQRATELAMLAMLDELSNHKTVEAIEGHHRIQGARRFLEILKSFPEKLPPLTPRASHNIDHNLK